MACGGGGGSSSTAAVSGDTPAVAQTNYNGPGSKWDFELSSDGTFAFERRNRPGSPVTMAVDGDYAELDNGFMSLTVTSATGNNAPDAGDTGWAVEIPGFALLLKPTNSDELIPMVQAGECPTGDFLANWVSMRSRDGADATDTTQDYLGTFAYNAQTQTATIPGNYALAGNFAPVSSGALPAGDCQNGILEVADAAVYLSNQGSALVHTGLSEPEEASILFANPPSSIAAMADLDGEYAGVLFNQSPDANTAAVVPATVSCNAGLCDVALLDDVTDTVPATELDLNLSGTLDWPETGMITGEIVDGGDAGAILCTVSSGVGTQESTLMSCVGQVAQDNTKMFNLLIRG